MVSFAQLVDLGLESRGIARRVRSGMLTRIGARVYLVGPGPLTLEGRWMAAVLSAGSGAVLSHLSAAMLWGLSKPAFSIVHVSVPRTNRTRSKRQLRVHRSTSLDGWTKKRDRIPTTNPIRTILDCSELLLRRPLERLIDEGERTKLVTPEQLRAALQSHPGRKGTALLVAVLQEHQAGTTATANDFEELFLDLCDHHAFPRPLVNERLAGTRTFPDFRWPAERLLVETDGGGHQATTIFEADHERDNERGLEGWLVLRFTWRQLTRRRDWVADCVSRGLAREA